MGIGEQYEFEKTGRIDPEPRVESNAPEGFSKDRNIRCEGMSDKVFDACVKLFHGYEWVDISFALHLTAVRAQLSARFGGAVDVVGKDMRFMILQAALESFDACEQYTEDKVRRYGSGEKN